MMDGFDMLIILKPHIVTVLIVNLLSLIVSVITQDPEEQFSAMNSTFK